MNGKPVRHREIYTSSFSAAKNYYFYQDTERWDSSRPLLLGLHGYSHNGYDFLRILNHILIPDLLRVTLDGPHHFYLDPLKKKDSGFSFFTRGSHLEEELEFCRLLVENTFSSLKTCGPAPSQIFLFGFSQGASVSLYLACKQIFPVAGIIVYSGFLPPSVPDEELLPLKDIPILLLQGEEDDVFTQEYHLSLKEKLERVSGVVSQKFVKGKHRIHQTGIREIEGWLQQNIK